MFSRTAVVMGGTFLGGKGRNAKKAVATFPDYLIHKPTSELLDAYPEAKAYMTAGKMVPNNIVYDAVRVYLENLKHPFGLLADGWVREPEQARIIYRFLTEVGYARIVYAEFNVQDDKILEARRLERWNREHRPDDEYHTAWARIAGYRPKAQRILKACIAQRYEIHQLDASRTFEEVFNRFMQILVGAKSAAA